MIHVIFLMFAMLEDKLKYNLNIFLCTLSRLYLTPFLQSLKISYTGLSTKDETSETIVRNLFSPFSYI